MSFLPSEKDPSEYHKVCQKVTGLPQLSVPDCPGESCVWLINATLGFLMAPLLSTWRFHLPARKNCVFAPHSTAKAPSSSKTSGGFALLSRALQAALPASLTVPPLLHQIFWPYPCKLAVIAVTKEFIAVDHAASVGYQAAAVLYPAAAALLLQFSTNTPSATQG